MDDDTYNDYVEFAQKTENCRGGTPEYFNSLWKSVYQSNHQSRYSKPMPWIGIYIILASVLCSSVMMIDLFHGVRYKKQWFPCHRFTLNAAYLTVMGVAIKLPMDLTDLMPGFVDQAAKLGSLPFMCTMMAIVLPSLATMANSKQLVSNILALGLVVITLVVNVCIELNTGVLLYHSFEPDRESWADFVTLYAPVPGNNWIPAIYVVLLLMLLMIYACSSLAILRSKEMLEKNYQAAHETALKDQKSQKPGSVTVEKLKQHVSKYLIMARTGNPQFMTVCSVTTMAFGVICVSSTFLHVFIMIFNIRYLSDYKSDYKKSILWILVVQSLGVVIGTIAPFSRCFAALSFELSLKLAGNHTKVFKIENCWTQELYYQLKPSSKPSSPPSSSKFRIGIQKLKILILNICIGFQKTVVVICKIISLIPVLSLIGAVEGFRCLKRLKAMCISPGLVSVTDPQQAGSDENLGGYVVQLQKDLDLAERALKGISKSVNHLIEKGKKQQPNNLIKFLPKSKSFQGLGKFDSRLVPSLLPNEYLNCWRLQLVTLTTIAMSLPVIPDDIVISLMSSVTEGLKYVIHVEESLNTADDHASIQQAAKSLWLEVNSTDRTWLGKKLLEHAPQVNTAQHILQWFSESAKNTVTEMEKMAIGDRNYISKRRSIAANSMYRITETILLSHINVSEEDLFELLSSWIADILVACLTNLPRVIAMKCHTNAIEKREASVHAAAKLLCETMKIINTVNKLKHPDLNPDELAYIDKWHAKYN